MTLYHYTRNLQTWQNNFEIINPFRMEIVLKPISCYIFSPSATQLKWAKINERIRKSNSTLNMPYRYTTHSTIYIDMFRMHACTLYICTCTLYIFKCFPESVLIPVNLTDDLRRFLCKFVIEFKAQICKILHYR